ncbi:hypothetical protein [Alishewanella phage vB_AspM_Slicko01]|nr:hypothetical protein [Alishewanella phage vB_AspM_Slicko01]
MIRELFCRLTGYRYHYRINLKYRTKSNTAISDVTMTAVVTSPKFINEARLIKQNLAHILIDNTPKHSLCNGKIVLEPIMYIGFLKAKNKNKKDK